MARRWLEGAVPERWVDDVAPDDRTNDVAARTIEGRLQAVLHSLPLASEKSDEDIEHVHQLRVWTRRATAAVRLYEELLPRRRCLWLKKQLKRVRRAANDARDCDVLIERLEQRPAGEGTRRWLKATRADRAEAQEAIVAVANRLLRRDRFAKRSAKLIERIRSRGAQDADADTQRFGDWARSRLPVLIEHFFAAVPADRSDAVALHQFRIAGKELRYAMELVANAISPRLRTDLYPIVEELQDRLGELNDFATAKARLALKIAESKSTREAAAWRRLRAGEQEQLDDARQGFWEWCTPALLEALREGFDAALGA